MGLYTYESIVLEPGSKGFLPRQIKRFAPDCRISVQYLKGQAVLGVYDPSWHKLAIYSVDAIMGGSPLLELEVVPATRHFFTEEFIFAVDANRLGFYLGWGWAFYLKYIYPLKGGRCPVEYAYQSLRS